MTKITRVAAERSARKRLEYLARIGQYQAGQLVFVDESSVDHRTTYRGRAWSIKGTKAQRNAFFVRGQRFSVLPALSLRDGILHCSVVKGSFCTDSFMTFINRLLDNMELYPVPNSVIVMDNCWIHKYPDIMELIESSNEVSPLSQRSIHSIGNDRHVGSGDLYHIVGSIVQLRLRTHMAGTLTVDMFTYAALVVAICIYIYS